MIETSNSLPRDLLISLKSDLSIESPFTDTELCDDYFYRATSSALDLLNMYRPNIIRSCDPLKCDSTLKLIRAYSNEYNSTSHIPDIDEFLYDNIKMARYYLYSKDWTIEDLRLDSNELDFYYFKKLVKILVCLYISNKRRKVIMNSSPFDLRGDQFYQEYKDSYDSLKMELINASYNTY